MISANNSSPCVMRFRTTRVAFKARSIVGMDAAVNGSNTTARTACINRIRGLLAEFGIVLAQKAEVVRRQAGLHLEDLPGYANLVIGDLLSEVHHLDERIKQYDAHVRSMARDCTAAQQLMQLCGVGETTATAIVTMVGNGAEFSSGRQFAA